MTCQYVFALEPPPSERCALKFNNGASLTVPVARTSKEMRQGLMGRTDPTPGMLFVWSKPGIRGVWMKNTKAPLSAAWIDGRGEIQAVLDLNPLSTEKRSSFLPAIAILELPRGTFESIGVGTGSRVQGACLPRR
ncbi:hypothetical protein B1F73_21495 [Pseudomonas syringae]|nr:hypothetical protein B1F77_16900 [Pseudomonas syringae]RXT83662.1 hypothetical protein B1F72_19360 [Pseudomonas syringae]RXT95496.1 hypothetical protein B1F73_21495 [Pseudomonas syringae]RXU23093.1 hypothetical protein B0A92_18365 [Pseudomonas syringae]